MKRQKVSKTTTQSLHKVWQGHRWRKEHRALELAFEIAKERFSNVEGVIGFGIGRAFREEKGRYRGRSARVGGLCVQIVVQEKRPLSELSARERIPKTIQVTVPRRGRCRVPIDVLSAPRLRLQAGPFKHTWPTLGAINVGRIFAFDQVRPADGPSGTFANQEPDLGTTAAIIRTANNEFASISAGHVFVDVCGDGLGAPPGPRRVGVIGQQWTALAAGNLQPTTLEDGAWVVDVMCMRLPSLLLPTSPNWPPLFARELATQDDINAAVASDDANGFVWVEREARHCQALPIDLLGGLDTFAANVCDGKQINYRFVWPYRFLDQETVGGDSGAGVFVPAIDRPGFCRFLGFHFCLDEDKSRGYAMDARVFFRRLFGAQFGTAFSFA